MTPTKTVDEDVKRTNDDGTVEESDYSTIDEQKELLKNALEDEDEIIRHGFCNRIEDCKKCLLGTHYRMATYGECRQHAKKMAVEEDGNPKHIKRNKDKFDNWEDAYATWQSEVGNVHPDAIAATNSGKVMKMIWMFAQWMYHESQIQEP